jgi:hypothetical protein
MIYRPELPHAELPRGARVRVRLPAGRASTGLFPGWGPTV